MKHRLSRTWQLKQTHRLSGAWHWQLKHIHISVRNEDVHTEHVNNTSMSTLTQRMRMPIQNMSTPANQHLHTYRTCQQHQQVNTYIEDEDAHTEHVNNTSWLNARRNGCHLWCHEVQTIRGGELVLCSINLKWRSNFAAEPRKGKAY